MSVDRSCPHADLPLLSTSSRSQLLTYLLISPFPAYIFLSLQISRGLSHIHAHGLAHLDIKPGNIFLCRSPTGPLVSPMTNGESSHVKFPISPPYPISPAPVTIVSPGCSCCSGPSDEPLPTNTVCIEKCTYKIGDMGHVVRTDQLVSRI